MPKNLPVVAIVGKPNAGKSTLINKIIKERLAITSEVAGTTRDRQYLDTAWNGVDFTLLDTAGLNFNPSDELQQNISKQIEVAVTQADAIVLVVDGKQPVSAIEQNILKKFRNIKKPVLLAINKLDSARSHEEKLAEFSRLGIKHMFPISSVSGLGIGDLLDEVVQSLPNKETNPLKVEDGPMSIAVSIIGKPNVGKSSIFNSILKSERTVVSAVPGTTRAAIDEKININGTDFTFIDTAGLKKKVYRQEQPDVFGGFQTFKSIRRSDVCLFVIDANDEITKQDQIIANEILQMEKGCVILANKSDLINSPPQLMGRSRPVRRSLGEGGGRGSKSDDKFQSLRDTISLHFPHLWMCPVFFVSAVTGEGIFEAVNTAKSIYDRRNKKIDNQTLSEFLTKMARKNPPKLLRDQRNPKVLSLRQTDVNPPTFELLVNYPAAISQQFRKFLENSIIKELDFWGTPIVLKLRGKDKS